MTRKRYRLTKQQFDSIIAATRPLPLMYLSGGMPMGRSQQERANDAWAALGREMGFDGASVEGVGSDPMDFTAFEVKRIVHEATCASSPECVEETGEVITGVCDCKAGVK
jgi:hypothetical protein